MTTRINKLIIGCVALAFCLLSCSRNEVFFDYLPIGSAGWLETDTLVFNPVIDDSLSTYNLFLEVRNDNRYAYQNLWLYIDGLQGADIVAPFPPPFEVLLANEFGKWHGKGFSIVYELSVPYLQGVRFSHAGEQRITIRHGMDNTPLVGIKSIGFRVVKSKK